MSETSSSPSSSSSDTNQPPFNIRCVSLTFVFSKEIVWGLLAGGWPSRLLGSSLEDLIVLGEVFIELKDCRNIAASVTVVRC